MEGAQGRITEGDGTGSGGVRKRGVGDRPARQMTGKPATRTEVDSLCTMEMYGDESAQEWLEAGRCSGRKHGSRALLLRPENGVRTLHVRT